MTGSIFTRPMGLDQKLYPHYFYPWRRFCDWLQRVSKRRQPAPLPAPNPGGFRNAFVENPRVYMEAWMDAMATCKELVQNMDGQNAALLKRLDELQKDVL